ncbi:hypothetical protein QZH41_006452 [Actinostola sp. cb2023]|nr:hypothetical protein QZH41_006452 [Actinostola sp. cb2023]
MSTLLCPRNSFRFWTRIRVTRFPSESKRHCEGALSTGSREGPGDEMLNTTLKRGKLSAADQTHLQLLDPFVSVLSKCLHTKYTKAMTAIIRDFNKYTIAQKHLQVLLGFVEEDIHDYSRQGTAFPLLKAILTRKLIVPEIHDVMTKVSQLSITGATPTVQQQCRQCVVQYLLDYPLGKKLQRLLEFFVSQLSYEHETGRESALEMMSTIFSAFPEFRSFFLPFVPFFLPFVRSSLSFLRSFVPSSLRSFLRSPLRPFVRSSLRSFVPSFVRPFVRSSLRSFVPSFVRPFVRSSLRSFVPSFVRPFVRSFVRFVRSSLSPFVRSFIRSFVRPFVRSPFVRSFVRSSLRSFVPSFVRPFVRPFVRSLLCPFVRSFLRSFVRPFLCSSLRSSLRSFVPSFVRSLSLLFEYASFFFVPLTTRLVNDDSANCRKLTAASIKGLLNKLDVERRDILYSMVIQWFNNDKVALRRLAAQVGGLFVEVEGKAFDRRIQTTLPLIATLIEPHQYDMVVQLCNDFCHQLESQYLQQDLSDQRSCVMRWLAAVAMVFGKDDVMPYLKNVLQPIHRELEVKTTYKDPELQRVTQEVLELVKGLVGRESVSRVYAGLQGDVTDTKEKRKTKRALEAAADPSQNARKKMKRNLSKRESRKRKIEKFKPERKLKKTRFVEIDD